MSKKHSVSEKQPFIPKDNQEKLFLWAFWKEIN